MNKAVDCLLVHSVMDEGGKISYQVMPMGFFSMADFLVKNGYKCIIVNIGVEKFLNRNFSIIEYVKKYNPRVVAIDLHWYVHSFTAIELAREIKHHCNNVSVILGGYTASFFSKEIMEKFPFVNGIIHGEGEVPLLEYLRNLKAGTLENAPNLTYRRGNKIIYPTKISPIEIVVLDRFSYSNVFLMDHWETYVTNCGSSGAVAYIHSPKSPKRLFYLSFGRGCAMDCSYCSGGISAYTRFVGQRGIYYRPVEIVLYDIKTLSKLGIDGYNVENGPFPIDDRFYTALFQRIREEGLDIGLNFCCSPPPSDKFLEIFARTFNLQKSCLSIWLQSGDEYVRKLNRGRAYYSNAQLLEVVEKMCAQGIPGTVYLSFGMPGENYSRFEETLKMLATLRKKRIYVSIRNTPIEPGSGMWVNPEKYRIKRIRNYFIDYYTDYRALSYHRVPAHPFGYSTEHFSEKEMGKLKIKAYRKCYLRPKFLFNRLRKFKKQGDILESFKLLFAVFVGSANLLERIER